jgi:hypothetical protein
MNKRLAFVLGSCPFVLLRAFVSLPSFGCGYAAPGNLWFLLLLAIAPQGTQAKSAKSLCHVKVHGL